MPLKKNLLLFLCTLVIGLLAAFTSHLFLASLTLVTDLRESHNWLIWSLPLLGLLMSYAQKHLPSNLSWNVTHLLFELREPRHRANPFLALWIFITSSLTHLGGGSVGREGVGLLMNGSLVDGITPFKEHSEERSLLLQAALSAGFAGMFGTPLTAIFFIFEINEFRFALSPLRWLLILSATFTTFLVSYYLETPHQQFPRYQDASWLGLGFLFMAIPMAAHGFYFSFKFFHKLYKPWGRLALPVGGVVLSLIFTLIGTRYAGLGTSIITTAVTEGVALPWDWMAKMLLTALTIGIGFKGGEVTPLFFIGATLGAAIGGLTQDPDLAKIGMVAVLGSLTHTPLSAGLLASELFGPSAFMWSFLISVWGKASLKGRHLYRLD